MLTPLVLESNFNDVDALADAVNAQRRVQISQIGLGNLQCQLLLAQFNEAQFAFLESSLPLQFRGPKGEGFIDFAFSFSSNQRCLISHGIEVSNNTMFGFDTTRENNVVLPAKVQLGVVQVRKKTFEACLEVMNRRDINEHFLARNYLHIPTTIAGVTSYLKELHWLIRRKSSFLRQSHLRRLILEDFLPLLIEATPPVGNEDADAFKPSHRSQLVKEAEDYMKAHLDKPLTLTDLCKALGTSQRPLAYGFQEIFGTSPMAYLKFLRLNAIRQVLKSADPETTVISDLASQFGFWSPGHFARDYKAMFGEMPSETLIH